MFAALCLLVAGAVLAPIFARRSGRGRIAIAALFAALIALLALNAIDVATFGGRAAYAVMGLAGLVATIAGLSLIPSAALRAWFALAAFALLAETGFRAFPLHNTLAGNPGIRFFWPDWVRHPLNNFGHRDRDFVTPKPPRVFRVLLLGDSFTEGAGLSRGQTFGRLIEAQLGVEVYNLGHSGANTRDEADTLLRDGPRLDPDLVILNYVPNDAETHPLEQSFQDLPGWVVEGHREIVQRAGSYAAYALLNSLEAMLPKHFSDGIAFYQAQHAPGGKGWATVTGAMAEIADWSAARDVPVIGVYWPVLHDRFSTLFADQVIPEMRRHGFDTVDLTATFTAGSKSLGDLAINAATDGHPNARANELAAAAIGDAIRRRLRP